MLSLNILAQHDDISFLSLYDSLNYGLNIGFCLSFWAIIARKFVCMSFASATGFTFFQDMHMRGVTNASDPGNWG